MEACCTCATLLATVPRHSTKSEKPLPEDRRLECCSRVICGSCIHGNSRFASYCPYCQISTLPSTLPQGLKEPPSYDLATSSGNTISQAAAPPPPYTPHPTTDPLAPLNEKNPAASNPPDSPTEDTLHFLDHAHDSIPSLSLRYGVPAAVLRATNHLPSDALLPARRTVLIPGAWYKGGVSLSPRPVEGEEEELRKGKIRRWMVGCKVAEYDVAVLYLEQAGYDLELATEAYFADEAWERDHPLQGKGKGKGKGTGSVTGTRAAQVAALRRRRGR